MRRGIILAGGSSGLVAALFTHGIALPHIVAAGGSDLVDRGVDQHGAVGQHGAVFEHGDHMAALHAVAAAAVERHDLVLAGAQRLAVPDGEHESLRRRIPSQFMPRDGRAEVGRVRARARGVVPGCWAATRRSSP